VAIDVPRRSPLRRSFEYYGTALMPSSAQHDARNR
jgi:hypothetical protein